MDILGFIKTNKNLYIYIYNKKDERVFIKREREGKDGYLVIAPFVTAS
jgi:hypothetical protein